MKQITLTKSEREIMNLLWNIDRPLTATEIVNLTPERTWKKSYIHLLINSLMNKNLIKTESLVRTGRNYGRAFVATSTREEFEISQITCEADFSETSVPSLVRILLDSVSSREILEEVDGILKEKKEKSL